MTLETPRPVPRADVVRLLRGLVESQNLELIADSAAGLYKVRAKEATQPPYGPQPQQPGAQRAESTNLFVVRLRHARAAADKWLEFPRAARQGLRRQPLRVCH